MAAVNGLQHSVESESGSWEHDPHSQFFRDQGQWESNPQARHYSHQLLRAKDSELGLGFDWVLCIDGQPTVYFKRVPAKNPTKERDLHWAVWNQGAATLLVVDDAKERSAFTPRSPSRNKTKSPAPATAGWSPR